MQKGVSDLRIIKYIEDDHRTLDSYSAELKNLPITGVRCIYHMMVKPKTLSMAHQQKK
jgi:hypothetical protein